MSTLSDPEGAMRRLSARVAMVVSAAIVSAAVLSATGTTVGVNGSAVTAKVDDAQVVTSITELGVYALMGTPEKVYLPLIRRN